MNLTRLLHLSDLHIGRTKKEEDRCRRVFQWISIHYPGEPVLVTGDLTHSGTEKQCLRMRGLLDGLAASNAILTVPGNHDYGFLGLTFEQASWKNWYSHLTDPLGWPGTATWSWLDHDPENFLGVLKHGGMAYFGLDSCDPEDEQICARGLISKGLAIKLAQELRKEEYSKLTRVVMLHHHPFKGSLWTALRGSRRLLTAVEGNCHILLFGHHHHCGIWWHDRKIPMIVGSHKTTNILFGESLALGVIGIHEPGTEQATFEYRMEATDLDLLQAA